MTKKEKIDELIIANEEKAKREAELVIANKQKAKREAELVIAKGEKEKRAEELIIANIKKAERADELIIANKELAYQNEEKGKRADELIVANKELAFQNEEKEKRAAELIIANKKLVVQNKEKEKRAGELILANKELAYQNSEKEKRAAELIIAGKDITDRKKKEEELRVSKDLLEKLNYHLDEVRENERASIARDIHDQLGQSLTALKLDINRMQEYVTSNQDAMTMLNGMLEMVTNTISDVQRITADLRPGILDDLGLVSAIDWYCGEFSTRTGIKCKLRFCELINEDSKRNLIFFRVLQEALTNVIRHANATTVKIGLYQSYKGITLTIKDNGIGITREQAVSGKSLGLTGIRERVKQSNGKFDISSDEGTGTKLIIFIPYK